ncbi:MAG: hypothetical protein IKT40_05000 [Bacilli bacterium]|nr:hypothetical protein [Bacilli bacterium]
MQRDGRPVMMKLRCNKLPDSIVAIGMNAFYYGGPNIKLTKLPDALTNLGSWSFTRCSGL